MKKVDIPALPTCRVGETSSSFCKKTFLFQLISKSEKLPSHLPKSMKYEQNSIPSLHLTIQNPKALYLREKSAKQHSQPLKS